MSDLAALEIIASINKLASEVNNSNQTKGLSWIGPIVGVLTGFFINLAYNYFQSRVKHKKFQKTVEGEISRMKKHAERRIKSLLSALDATLENPQTFPYAGSIGFSIICYEKYYHEISSNLNDNQNNMLSFCYAYIIDAEKKSESFEDFLKNNDRSSAINYTEKMIVLYWGSYKAIESYFSGKEIESINITDISKSLGIDSSFLKLKETGISPYVTLI